MRVQTEEWRRFIPGVRMYKGKTTLFWNGQPLSRKEKERQKWEVIIVLPGVEVIPVGTFLGCENVKTVIMSDTVTRVEGYAFHCCYSLEFVKLSRNLEYIGFSAFLYCHSLTSICIPPSCREIGNCAFCDCIKLIILSVPQHTTLGRGVFQSTALITKSTIETDEIGIYNNNDEERVVRWVKSINNTDALALHRACSSFNPMPEIIHPIVRRQGIESMRMKNSICVTPSQYLAANTFATISEKEIIRRYVLDMMGEIV